MVSPPSLDSFSVNKMGLQRSEHPEMPRLVFSSEKHGCGATIELDSQEICLVSVSQSGVLVRSSRGRFRRTLVGIIGAILYSEKNVFKAAMTAAALDSLFPPKRIPLTFQNPVLGAFANAIWQCSSAADICVALNTARSHASKSDFQPRQPLNAKNR
jgi:hypothetical protein